ncbi:MAG: hypothetical protein F6J93_09505 [Oscillatoria sp. SIO1A7]|nr:hypothetical protein [Oscillatoria sp. SIO1A7]
MKDEGEDQETPHPMPNAQCPMPNAQCHPPLTPFQGYVFYNLLCEAMGRGHMFLGRSIPIQ